MNRIKLLLLATVCTLSAHAQLNGDGYYRAQSSEQGRYIRVIDNRGSVNISTTDADMEALRTRAGFENVVSDPSSIIYIKKMNKGYDFQSQGTGSYQIISYEVLLNDMGDNKYWCSASKAGMTKYLADQLIDYEKLNLQVELGYITEEQKQERLNNGHLVTNIASDYEGGKYLDWNILPVKDAEGFYFGLQPNIASGDSYYQTFYAAFPFTFLSEGMSAWYVSKVNEATGKVIIKEVTGGVPKSTPVIIKCASQSAASNKLNVGASTSGTANDNLLTGVYFCNPDAGPTHTNVVAYDANTMRVLGTAADGSLAFVKDNNLKYIPANTAYITVSASAPAILKVTDKEEEPAVPGDLSGDGEVTGQDLVIEANFILNNEFNEAADLNKDGIVSGQDYVILVNKVLGK
jgi:hypothetical protein